MNIITNFFGEIEFIHFLKYKTRHIKLLESRYHNEGALMPVELEYRLRMTKNKDDFEMVIAEYRQSEIYLGKIKYRMW